MDEDNIIQNPLLCALRETASASVLFVPDDDSDANEDTQTGTLVVESPDFKRYSLADLIDQAKQMIERRVPHLAGREPSSDVLVALRRKAAEDGHFHESDELEEEDQEQQQADEIDPSSVLFEESHILDFWEELAGRLTLLREIGPASDFEEFLGFTKDAMISYLCPIVLVDGQHRLKGAIKAAYESITTDSVRVDIQNRISEGEAADAVEQEMLRSKARLLPISLLMSSDPAEQVFQFVVVNQKATPVGSALLGTIVSTTLSKDEMDVVAGRLKKAGIKLEESQAITFLARHPESPFSGLIERGLTGDAKDLLQWNETSEQPPLILPDFCSRTRPFNLTGDCDRWPFARTIPPTMAASLTA